MASMEQRIILPDGLELRLKRSSRARRMTLRVPRDGSDPILTLPVRVPLHEGRAFAESRQGWLQQALGRVPARQTVTCGVHFPVGGAHLLITAADIRQVQVQDDLLLVPQNRPAGVVVSAWMRQVALARLRPACDRFSAALGRPYRAIALRDTKSRWGSCTHDGRLMFSWRLAMAPLPVLTYVAAHEVAHLAHMDHSARFWAQVHDLMPDHAPHRAWLKTHGGDLMQWQFRD